MPFVEDHHELVNLLVTGMPSAGVREALVGETPNFTTRGNSIGVAQTTTLTRKPAGSAAAIASNAFTIDLPGLYTVTVLMAVFTRTYSLYAFPVSFLTTRVNADQPGSVSPPKTYTRSHLALVVSQPGGVSAAQLAAHETASPAPTLALLGPIAAWANLAGA